MPFSEKVLLGIVLIAAMLLGGGCGASRRFSERPPAASGREQHPPPDSPVRSSSDKVLLSLEGIVSYYADDFQGKQTSNGETFDMHSLTAAHRTFPFGTKVRVTNLENNLTVIVRVNDRGPFKEGRIMDLSLAAAKEINLIRTGTARAKLEVLEWGKGQ